MVDIAIRDVRDDDSEEMFAVLGEVFAEYPGCVLERSEYPELVRPATSFAAMRGKLWIATRDERIVGFVAYVPEKDPKLAELRKLYTRKEARGVGLGRRLVTLVEEEARRRGNERIHLWSDTRFVTAHAVYERMGYVRLPETRELHDVSASIEYHFEKKL